MWTNNKWSLWLRFRESVYRWKKVPGGSSCHYSAPALWGTDRSFSSEKTTEYLKDTCPPTDRTEDLQRRMWYPPTQECKACEDDTNCWQVLPLSTGVLNWEDQRQHKAATWHQKQIERLCQPVVCSPGTFCVLLTRAAFRGLHHEHGDVSRE